MGFSQQRNRTLRSKHSVLVSATTIEDHAMECDGKEGACVAEGALVVCCDQKGFDHVAVSILEERHIVDQAEAGLVGGRD